ncbi:FkbM family methyltransferase [Chamaesiphon sp. VAR_48_metabat_135_sub]|uniref:FkbM family methyltransferase n=1 Tax=Chamaesiphon sp. VAR_48_metabat_135_sub TaxID=2964699 RepID=UPI00286C65A3|nr:FkbM family methyltransferase [Chamaesiphon sp. VAR_48_metabat_135_sub]
MKKFFGRLLAILSSKIFSLLRGGKPEMWERDEIRQMKYSFSQFGEDVVISKYLDNLDPQDGIYLDVGSFNPITFSNTLLLHKRGWQGINIDIDPDKIDEFIESRPSDFNVVAAVSDKVEKLKFACYPSRATNQLFPLESTEHLSILGQEPTKVVILETTRLDKILESSPFSDKSIHYMNIDCEGHDFNVLISFDIERYYPKVISIEAWTDEDLGKIENYLLPKGYKLSAYVHPTQIFTRL